MRINLRFSLHPKGERANFPKLLEIRVIRDIRGSNCFF